MNQNTERKIDALMFESYNTKNQMYFDMAKDFTANELSGVCGFNKFEGELKVIGYIEDKDDVGYGDYVDVGVLRFHAYNLNKLGFYPSYKNFNKANADSSLLHAMEMDNPDTEVYFHVFQAGYKDAWKDAKGKNIKDINFEYNQYLVTFDRCYINPEYRNQGISDYIHSHLFELLYTYFNITPTFMVGICKPDESEPEGMKAVQEKIMKKHGFRVFQLDDYTGFCKCIYNRDFLDEIQM